MRESFQLAWSVQPEAFRQMTLEICGFHGGAYENYLLKHDKPPCLAEIYRRLRGMYCPGLHSVWRYYDADVLV